jgi:hypothetical protein
VTSIHFPAAINRIVEPKPASGVLQIGRGRDAQFFSWHLDMRGPLCRDRLGRSFLSDE